MAYSPLFLKNLGICYHNEIWMTVFQSSLASYYESRDEFTLQVCDYMISVLQRRENIRESLRKFSNLDYKSLP